MLVNIEEKVLRLQVGGIMSRWGGFMMSLLPEPVEIVKSHRDAEVLAKNARHSRIASHKSRRCSRFLCCFRLPFNASSRGKETAIEEGKTENVFNPFRLLCLYSNLYSILSHNFCERLDICALFCAFIVCVRFCLIFLRSAGRSFACEKLNAAIDEAKKVSFFGGISCH